MRKVFTFIVAVVGFLFLGLLGEYTAERTTQAEEKTMRIDPATDTIAVATFSGGCFWCSESDFEKAEGVLKVISGFAGGAEKQPSYKAVAAGQTSHREGVQVHYNPDIISYRELLDVFWRHIDPTDVGGQFVDRGLQYRTAVFYHNEAQRQAAEESKAMLARSGRFDKPIVTEILPYSTFYAAEDYHQDYYKKNPIRYHFYRYRSGRDQFIESVWGSRKKVPAERKESADPGSGVYQKPAHEALRNQLSPLEYQVTQENGTEPPFDNRYWDNKHEGLYVDVVSGEPLFSSVDKFTSGTGWPSFTRPLEPDNIVEVKDRSHFMVRTEVRSKHADSHLGHVFPDGPKPTGLRYCINSAALRFIPKEKLDKEGYEKYKRLFP